MVDTLGKSVLAFHWSHWPWTQQQEARIDSLQRHIIGHMLRVRPLAGEAFDVFTHRKSILTGRLQTAHGRWSAAWCGSLADWEAHCNRSSDWGGWAGSLLDFQGPRWLEGMRILHTDGASLRRTGTRAAHGAARSRWLESIEKMRLRSSAGAVRRGSREAILRLAEIIER